MHWITKPQALMHGTSALKQHTRPTREVSASSFTTAEAPPGYLTGAVLAAPLKYLLSFLK